MIDWLINHEELARHIIEIETIVFCGLILFSVV